MSAGPRVLLTGFGPFDGMPVNPSEAIVAGLAAGQPASLQTRIFPVDYDEVDRLLPAAIAEVRPEIVLLFGVAGSSDRVRVETTARNRDDSVNPDLRGERRRHRPIDPAGPATLLGTLPVAAILDALERAGIPAVRSDDAGGYLCNHAYYRAIRTLDALDLLATVGFVHVPPLGGLFDVGLLTAAGRCCLEEAIRAWPGWPAVR
ncbi:MAG: pyroglutamyl-peptidase I [Dehalococcoidia bacterium]